MSPLDPGPEPVLLPEPERNDLGRPDETARRHLAIALGSVPSDVDAGIADLVRTGEFPDTGSAAIALLREALAARGKGTSAGTEDPARTPSGAGLARDESQDTATQPDARQDALNGAAKGRHGAVGRSGIP